MHNLQHSKRIICHLDTLAGRMLNLQQLDQTLTLRMRHCQPKTIQAITLKI
jgi:hypothetical protein